MRIFNRIAVFALGVALAALGFVAAVEAVWTGLGYRFIWFPGRAWLTTLRRTSWSTRSVLVGAAVAALVGLLLLVAELRPASRRLARFDTEGSDTWLYHRHAMEQHLRRALEQEIPTLPIKIDVSVSGHRWKLKIRARAAASTTPMLEQAGRHQLEVLGAPANSTVTVRTTRAPRVQ